MDKGGITKPKNQPKMTSAVLPNCKNKALLMVV